MPKDSLIEAIELAAKKNGVGMTLSIKHSLNGPLIGYTESQYFSFLKWIKISLNTWSITGCLSSYV